MDGAEEAHPSESGSEDEWLSPGAARRAQEEAEAAQEEAYRERLRQANCSAFIGHTALGLSNGLSGAATLAYSGPA